VLLAAGEVGEALIQARAGLQVAQETEHRWLMGMAHRVMGTVAGRLGSEKAGAEAGFHFEESIRILGEIGAEAELGRSQAAYGLCLTQSANTAETQRGQMLVDEARALLERLGMVGDLARLETEAASG